LAKWVPRADDQVDEEIDDKAYIFIVRYRPTRAKGDEMQGLPPRRSN
jgi:hypothetical protein